MKKSIKLISLLIIAIIAVFVGKEIVFAADNAPATFKASTTKMSYAPIGLIDKPNVKKTNGKYIYCLDITKNLPDSSVTYTKANLVSDPALAYIIASGYDDKTDEDFFATQAALWIYLFDTKQMNDTSKNYIQKIKGIVYNDKNASDPIVQDIRNILEVAKGAENAVGETKTLKIATDEDDIEFELEDGVYISNVIKVKSNLDSYTITLYDEPDGAKVTRTNNGFVITVPEDSIDEGKTKFSVVLEYSDTVYNVYKYTASNSKYQDVMAAYTDTLSLSDDVDITIAKEKEKEEEPEDPTVIKISKQDITTEKELPGATLVVRNSDGKIVDKWVSTNKPHTIDDLKPGKYTLEETIAPEGYVLSKEVISFTVKEDEKIKNITMYNTPEEVEELVVSISKQDITTKEEVPGATLIIRDNDGKELYRWVSGDKPYIIKGIEEGIYTLEEIIAPEGYILSNEKITFEVKDNGVITEVVMFNTPEADEVIIVPPTGMSASTIGYILGGLVIIIGSVLIYRNVKKEQ